MNWSKTANNVIILGCGHDLFCFFPLMPPDGFCRKQLSKCCLYLIMCHRSMCLSQNELFLWFLNIWPDFTTSDISNEPFKQECNEHKIPKLLMWQFLCCHIKMLIDFVTFVILFFFFFFSFQKLFFWSLKPEASGPSSALLRFSFADVVPTVTRRWWWGRDPRGAISAATKRLRAFSREIPLQGAHALKWLKQKREKLQTSLSGCSDTFFQNPTWLFCRNF